MPRFIIERTIPGASQLSASQLRDISAKSCAVVEGLGEPYVWETSFVAGDKFYCIHDADSADIFQELADEFDYGAIIKLIKHSRG